MKKVEEKKNVILYQTTSGAIELRGDSKADTLWATQAQIAQAFNVNVPTINEHIKNIYKTKELSEKATIRKIRIVQQEGKRLIERDVNHYNLDLIISVGYRVNSIKATKFRQWATKVLKQHVTDGFTVNKKALLKNYDRFIQTVTDIQALLPKGNNIDSESVLELVKSYAVTWAKLDAYDRDLLQGEGTNKKKTRLHGRELIAAIATLKKELIQNQQATEIFAQERERGALEGIIGNVMQTFNGMDLYDRFIKNNVLRE